MRFSKLAKLPACLLAFEWPRSGLRFLSNALIALLATLLSVTCSELALRAIYPRSALGAGVELDWFRDRTGEVAIAMTSDEEIGFRPKLGTDMYDADGFRRRHRHVSIHVQSQRKVLFIGDSVTARARIVDAIHKDWKDSTTEILNGGVESFNLSQEVNFFLRFQSRHAVDHIIHQVHGNDLQATPIAFKDEAGALNVYALHAPKQFVSEWLFRNSHLYRLGLAVFLSRRTDASTYSEARENFAKMATFATSRGISYQVVLFPILKPTSDWSSTERRDWNLLEAACRDVSTSCISLLPVLEQMLKEGRPFQESVGDTWHPNDDFARAAAKYIVQQGLPKVFSNREEE